MLFYHPKCKPFLLISWILISKLLCNLPRHNPSPLHSFTIPSAVPSRTLALRSAHSYFYCFFRYFLQVFALTQTWLFPGAQLPCELSRWHLCLIPCLPATGRWFCCPPFPFRSFLSPMWTPMGLPPLGFSGAPPHSWPPPGCYCLLFLSGWPLSLHQLLASFPWEKLQCPRGQPFSPLNSVSLSPHQARFHISSKIQREVHLYVKIFQCYTSSSETIK